mgnify:CR=1 FL=1
MYLKYEKTLYPLNDEQVKTIQTQKSKGGNIAIGNELLFAWKCEIVENVANKDEYELKYLILNKQIENEDYYKQINREHEANMKCWLVQSPEDKAKRSCEYMGKTQYMLRNGFKEPNEQRVELIKKKMIAYFQENNTAWCPREVYDDLMPPKKEVESIGGWAKIGDVVGI